ncbi:hypothetical protein [Glycomyces sp. MUSA5-2]|uniref:hypothetical protein n=1 Tax=Glycomyces sp. MUSA5-2 TaxID=2053002 RepID=UPI00300A7A4D
MQRIVLRTTAAAAALAVAGGALAACSSEPETSPEGVITIFAPQWPEQDLNDSAFTKILEDKFDVDLQFETTVYDAAAAAEKRQISLASGDYPDAYMLVPWNDQFSREELLKLGDQGVIVPLDDLIAEHAPNITAAFDKVPEYAQLAAGSDGTIWGLPQWNDCFHCSYTSKLWINTAWLDAVGMDQPTTPEELREVLRAFKTQDPNGNGEADEIPLSGSTGYSILPYLMDPFIYMPTSDPTGAQPASLALDGDQVTLQARQDGWREGLAYVRSLWEEGLIDDASFTQNPDALRTKGENPDATIIGASVIQNPANFISIGLEDERNADYDPVAPLTGPNGSPASWVSGSIPGATFVITNKASEAKQTQLIEILDYIYTYEGHLLGEFGTEGVNWAAPEEGDVPLDESVDPLFKILPGDPDNEEGQNTSWGAMTQYFSDAEFRGGQVVGTDIYSLDGVERRLFEATELYAANKPAEAFPYWNVWVTGDAADELATIQTNVESAVAQASAEFVSGARDISDDAAWDAFQAELDTYGADRYVEIYQAAWDDTDH